MDWETNKIAIEDSKMISIKRNKEGDIKSFVYEGMKFLHIKHISTRSTWVYFCPKTKLYCHLDRR